MRNYTNFICKHCGKYRGLKTDHTKCSKELQKLKSTQQKAARHTTKYQSNKNISHFLKFIGEE